MFLLDFAISLLARKNFSRLAWFYRECCFIEEKKLLKIFMSETVRPEVQIFGLFNGLVDRYQVY